MSIKLPIKKNHIVFGLFLMFFLIIFGVLTYLAASASAKTKAEVIERKQQSLSVQQTTSLLVRLKECANEHKSAKFNSIYTDFAVKFYDNAHSIDIADVQPALIECKRLAYQ